MNHAFAAIRDSEGCSCTISASQKCKTSCFAQACASCRTGSQIAIDTLKRGFELSPMLGRKVLLVDDDRDSLELTKLYLVKRGYQIFSAENGTQAVALYNEKKPDIVFLDIMMPGIDGFVTLRKLRSLDDDKFHPVIIMLTAKGGTEDVMAAIKFGANDYLVKPITEDRLLDKLKRHLGS